MHVVYLNTDNKKLILCSKHLLYFQKVQYHLCSNRCNILNVRENYCIVNGTLPTLTTLARPAQVPAQDLLAAEVVPLQF